MAVIYDCFFIDFLWDLISTHNCVCDKLRWHALSVSGVNIQPQMPAASITTFDQSPLTVNLHAVK